MIEYGMSGKRKCHGSVKRTISRSPDTINNGASSVWQHYMTILWGVVRH